MKKNAVVKWEEEMAKAADVAAGMEEGAGGGQFFSTKSGVLSWMDVPIPGNQMPVVILDSVLENVYYPGKWDPDSPQAPSCYAFGTNVKEMKPHSKVAAPENDKCEGCDNNEWGSADTGKGKACSNVRRIAMIPAGNFKDGDFVAEEELEHYKSVGEGYMKVPVTSVKGFSSFVTRVAGTLKRPPYGIFTKVSVVPDVKTTLKVVFEALETIPDKIAGVIMERHKEINATIDFPYAVLEEEPKPQKRSKNRKY